jgi:galactose mutarotase-like enzyme
MAYRIEVRGRNILWFPYSSPAELRQKPVLCGVPFLAPWANRLDGDAYWAGGKRYVLNPGLGNLRRDPNGKPIHGLLNFSPLWTVVDSNAVVFAPQGRDLLCFEPMSAVTDAFNLAHAGVFDGLQTIAPGGQWRESFRIVPTGF